MVGNKKVMCNVCYREMRSDGLKRHMKQHSKKNESVPATNILEISMYKRKLNDLSSEDPEQICKSILEDVINDIHNKDETSMYRKKPKLNDLRSDGLDELHNLPSVSTSDPIKRSNEKSKINKEELRKHLIKIENEYQKKVELGKEIYEMLGGGVVPYQALTRDMKEAVNLYIEKQADFRDVGNVELKPWQNELMKYIEPHDREIICVVGKDGNEGKNWFQKYVKSVFGTRKVVSGVDIKSNSASICQALQKCPIVTVDIFLFNIGKSRNKFNQINYDALESIKDGEALASKYDSQHLKIRVPNVVIVFSNSPPDVQELAKVRFRVFTIIIDQLKKKTIVVDPRRKRKLLIRILLLILMIYNTITL